MLFPLLWTGLMFQVLSQSWNCLYTQKQLLFACWFLYLETLPRLLVSFDSLLVFPFTEDVICKQALVDFLSICIPLISYSCQMDLVDLVGLCWIPVLEWTSLSCCRSWWECLQFFPIQYGFVMYCFDCVEKCYPYSHFT